jgi:hypothetical protein
MKIEEYYNLKMRRAIPNFLCRLGFRQHVFNLQNPSELPGENEFKFRFHPEQDQKRREYTFYVDFRKADESKVVSKLNRTAFEDVVYKAILPYGSAVHVEENLTTKKYLYSIKIIIKFNQDAWEFVNTYVLK